MQAAIHQDIVALQAIINTPSFARLSAQNRARAALRARNVAKEDQPNFDPELTEKLRQHAYQFLIEAMHNSQGILLDELFVRAGEELSNCFLNTENSAETLAELYNAAIAFYLGGQYSRAYVLMNAEIIKFSSSSDVPYRLLQMLFTKDLSGIYSMTTQVLEDAANNDERISASLLRGEITQSEAISKVLYISIYRAYSGLLDYVHNGDVTSIEKAVECLKTASQLAVLYGDYASSWLSHASALVFVEFKAFSLWSILKNMAVNDESELVRKYIKGLADRNPPILELWRSQHHAVAAINDSGRLSFCIKMPTGAGKTRIAELTILRFFLDVGLATKKKCIYVAPFRSLAAEVENTLQQSFRSVGLGVSELYGGYDFAIEEQDRLILNQIVVATPEKFDTLLRFDSTILKQIGLVILDEGHIIDSSERGLRYEIFLQRVIKILRNSGTRLLFISAVMPNADQFTQWITGDKTNLVETTWRSSDLVLGILNWNGTSGTEERIYRGLIRELQTVYVPRSVTSIRIGRKTFPRSRSKSELIALAGVQKCLADRDGCTLLFVPKPDHIYSVGESIVELLDMMNPVQYNLLEPPWSLPVKRDEYFNQCVQLAKEMTGHTSIIVQALERGVVLHHGKLRKDLRIHLEKLVRNKQVHLVVANTTLAQGVNLPIKTIFVHSIHRDQSSKIADTEFWNICGRAGRPYREAEGTVLILADKTNRKDADAQAYKELETYVSRGRAIEIESALGRLLKTIVQQWEAVAPSRSLAEMCQRLVENEIDWLGDNEQRQLGILDHELLKFLEELEQAEITANSIEELFSDAIVLLQLSNAIGQSRLNPQSALNILTARVEYLRKLAPDNRRFAYRTGLPITDLETIRSNKNIIEMWFGGLTDFMLWDPSVRCEYIVQFCRDVVIQLPSLFSDKDRIDTSLEPILRGWLEGKTLEQIAGSMLVETDAVSVGTKIDDICENRIPWAIHSIVGYLRLDTSESSLAIPKVGGFLPSMIRYGVYSPIAAILMSEGLATRSAANVCASYYLSKVGNPNQISWTSKSVIGWIVNIAQEEIGTWNIDSVTKQAITLFVEQKQKQSGNIDHFDADLAVLDRDHYSA